MTDATENVVPHPNREAWAERKAAQLDGDKRAQAAERDAARKQRLNEQRRALHAAANSKLSQEDRLTLARNLGRLALYVCRNDQRAAVRLAAGALEPNKHLRARWVRFPDEAIEQKSHNEIAAQLKGAVGATYLKIAENFAAASTADGRQTVTVDDATLRLLRGTNFDPRPELLQIATDQEAELNVCFDDIRAELIKLAPELSSYFELVSSLELQHPFLDGYPRKYEAFGRDTSRFVTVASTEGVGHLVPRIIADGYFFTEESRGTESLLPSVLLGTVSIEIPLHAVVLTEKEAAGLYSGDIDSNCVAEIFSLRADAATEDPQISWEFSLNVHLLTAPFGTASEADIGFGIYVTPTENPNERVYWEWLGNRQLIVRCTEMNPGEFRGAIFDRSTLSHFPTYAALSELEDRLWSVGCETARTLLFASITPQEFAFFLPAPLLTFAPAFSGVEGFAPLPANTLAGLIQRNNRPENGPTRLVNLLAADANARAARLSDQLAKWKQEFEAERINHRNALGLNEGDEAT